MPSQTVIATSDLVPGERLVIMNGLARPAWEDEPSKLIVNTHITRGEALLYNPDTRSIVRKKPRKEDSR
jgi:hypothetical protein